MGKHRRPSLFRRIFPKRRNWVDTVGKVHGTPKVRYVVESDSKVHIMPSNLEWFIPGDYSLN